MKFGPRGPLPSWMDEDGTQTEVMSAWVYESARNQLAAVLRERLRQLEKGDEAVIVKEAKRELAVQMADGNPSAMMLLLDMIEELENVCST